MKPETRRFMGKAKRCLAIASSNWELGFLEIAGHQAYYAALHAAQAYLFERLEKIAKTHGGAQAMLRALSADDPEVPDGLYSFLGRAYDLKVAADYVLDPAVTPAEAADALGQARKFVELVEAALVRYLPESPER